MYFSFFSYVYLSLELATARLRRVLYFARVFIHLAGKPNPETTVYVCHVRRVLCTSLLGFETHSRETRERDTAKCQMEANS